MFVGNSITRHGILPEIGWHNDHGMAASSIEKDYLHIVARMFSKKNEDASYCICQASLWEYQDGEVYLDLYEKARNFQADIIMRVIENCHINRFDTEKFIVEYDKLVSYLNYSGKANVIISTSFWKHKADNTIKEYANKNGFGLIELGDLGENDEMKAIGLFSNEGISNHPGDRGMEEIAKRILEKIL